MYRIIPGSTGRCVLQVGWSRIPRYHSLQCSEWHATQKVSCFVNLHVLFSAHSGHGSFYCVKSKCACIWQEKALPTLNSGYVSGFNHFLCTRKVQILHESVIFLATCKKSEPISHSHYSVFLFCPFRGFLFAFVINFSYINFTQVALIFILIYSYLHINRCMMLCLTTNKISWIQSYITILDYPCFIHSHREVMLGYSHPLQFGFSQSFDICRWSQQITLQIHPKAQFLCQGYAYSYVALLTSCSSECWNLFTLH